MQPLVEAGPELTPEQISRYSRHLLVPQIGMTGQRRLRNARVAVVGAGGLGCPALAYLAAAGVGQITVIDHDVVDVTNLQRQVLHRTADVGTPKVDSAARAVRALNPDVTVTPRHTEITADNAADLLRGHHVVFDGTDNFATRYVLADAGMALGLPVVWGAVLRFDAQVSTFVPGVAGAVSLRDLFPVPPRPEDVPSCAEAGVLGALVGQVGSIMAAEVVKLVVGFGEPLAGRVLLVDALSQRAREVPLRPVAEVAELAARPEAAEVVQGSASSEVSPPRVTPREVADGLAAGRGWTLLDVREPGEQALGMVTGARAVPVDEVLSWKASRLPPGPVVVYCKTGPRAQRAAVHLRRLGHADVSVMDGGIVAWIDSVDPSLPRY